MMMTRIQTHIKKQNDNNEYDDDDNDHVHDGEDGNHNHNDHIYDYDANVNDNEQDYVSSTTSVRVHLPHRNLTTVEMAAQTSKSQWIDWQNWLTLVHRPTGVLRHFWRA